MQSSINRHWPSRCRVSVVIPALNEAENLPHVLPRIPADVYEVILVDGNSTDGTSEVARQILPDIRIVQQTGRGKGNALCCGFEAATGDIIVMLDADGSTDPGEIPRFVGTLLAGADFAKGSRFLHGGGTSDMPLYRRLGNLGFVTTVRMLFGGRYSDLCYGYNAFWTSAIRHLNLDGAGFEIETMMNVRALRAGFRVVEVPSFEDKRIYGSSRLRTIPDGWRVLKTIWRERRNAVPALKDVNGWDFIIGEELPADVATLPANGKIRPIEVSAEATAASFASDSADGE
jgi:glycosyltransferase involved in cell wall biosynthesis